MASAFRIADRTAPVRAVLLAGIAGNVAISLYLSVALPVFFKRSPLLLFQWDAANITGAWAYAHGLAAAALGLFFDFIVSWCWAAAFTLLYANVPAVRRSPAIAGLIFGAVVMGVMLFLVVPLGHAARASTNPISLLDTLVAHTIFFGLPVALVVHRTLRLPRAQSWNAQG
ncbi:MAG: hypothetical protein WCD38_01440 [Candidatus Tumulicola sp.]